ITLDQARREIAEKLLIRDRKPQLLNTKVTALLAAVKENKAEALMKELQLSWKETGDFGIGARSIPGGIGSEKSARTAVVALKKPGDIAPEALDISGARYILRLKAKTSADLSKLEPTKRKELAESSKAMEAYGLFNALTSELRKKYESEGKIYKNPQFVQYDALLHQKPEE
ncbi:MAG: hypothetical protein NTX25_20700, partial [Proteobacteria bacterium]|nr:hypothetical protein [Pseudomonadota bacterium]